MMKRLLTIGLILVCHVAAFVVVYFGRINGVAMCGSDILLALIPFAAAVAAYAVVFTKTIKVQKVWIRKLLVVLASLVAGAISAEIGMVIAFNLWGT